MDVAAVYSEIAQAVNNAQLMGTTLLVTATDFAPDTPPIPAFQLARCQGTYERDFGGDLYLDITGQLLISRADDEGGQQEARRLAGTGMDTIRGAILAHRAQNGGSGWQSCDDAFVRSFSGPTVIDYGEVKYYALEFTIFAMGR